MPVEWSEKYKGAFDQRWDKLREETFERQKKLGVIPKDAVLTSRPDEFPAWDRKIGAPYAFTGTVKKVVFDLKPGTHADERRLHEAGHHGTAAAEVAG